MRRIMRIMRAMSHTHTRHRRHASRDTARKPWISPSGLVTAPDVLQF